MRRRDILHLLFSPHSKVSKVLHMFMSIFTWALHVCDCVICVWLWSKHSTQHSRPLWDLWSKWGAWDLKPPQLHGSCISSAVDKQRCTQIHSTIKNWMAKCAFMTRVCVPSYMENPWRDEPRFIIMVWIDLFVCVQVMQVTVLWVIVSLQESLSTREGFPVISWQI